MLKTLRNYKKQFSNYLKDKEMLSHLKDGDKGVLRYYERRSPDREGIERLHNQLVTVLKDPSNETHRLHAEAYTRLLSRASDKSKAHFRNLLLDEYLSWKHVPDKAPSYILALKHDDEALAEIKRDAFHRPGGTIVKKMLSKENIRTQDFTIKKKPNKKNIKKQAFKK